MTAHHSDSPCSHLLSYLLGVLDETKRQQFEAHLPDCDACRLEMEELQPVIQLLPYTAELQQPPAQLKNKVLQAAYQAKAPEEPHAAAKIHPEREAIPIDDTSASPTAWKHFVSNLYGRLSLGLIAVLTLSLGLSGWSLQQAAKQPPLARLQPGPSMNVEHSFALYPTADHPQGTGNAYLIRSNEGMQIVVQVDHVKPLTGDQAYQVWLLKNGQRQNAGTFVVNDQGAGILIYSLGKERPDFDSIGITREPDPLGTSPRGPKVLGSKL